MGSKTKDTPYVSVVSPVPERVTEEIDFLFSGIIATAKYFVLIAAQSVIPFRVTSSESPDPTFKLSSSPP